MDLGLTNKIAGVTGSNRGTGFIIAKSLTAEGVEVFVHSLSSCFFAVKRRVLSMHSNVRVDGGAVDIT